MFTDLRLKLHDFWRKRKKIIIIILIIWIAIIAVNYIIKNIDFKATPSTTYEPDTAIMGASTQVPKKIHVSITELIDEYVGYCNRNEYENAYNMLTDACKVELFENNITNFEIYVGNIFYEPKAYSVQDYYNAGDIYVYRLRLFEDILATGLTGEQDLSYITEIVTVDLRNNEYKLSVNQLIGVDILNKVYEDENIKVTVEKVKIEYEQETYSLKILNRTEYQIILLDHNVSSEILLNLDAETRKELNYTNGVLILGPGQTLKTDLKFHKYYHESTESRGITFNALRIVENIPATYDEEENILDAINTYSIKVPLINEK